MLKRWRGSGGAVLMAAVSLLAACAPIRPGASREEVVASRGQPTAVVPLASGTRLQYSGQPAGQYSLMVDLDASGRVVSAREVLNRENFARVVTGQWTRQDVERELGRPAKVDHVASWTGDIMTYRWRLIDQPMYFWVYLDPANVVQRTGEGMEFPFTPKER